MLHHISEILHRLVAPGDFVSTVKLTRIRILLNSADINNDAIPRVSWLLYLILRMAAI